MKNIFQFLFVLGLLISCGGSDDSPTDKYGEFALEKSGFIWKCSNEQDLDYCRTREDTRFCDDTCECVEGCKVTEITEAGSLCKEAHINVIHSDASCRFSDPGGNRIDISCFSDGELSVTRNSTTDKLAGYSVATTHFHCLDYPNDTDHRFPPSVTLP